MTYRNRALLDLAHDMPCQARFAHICNGPSVPAHANGQAWGRGFSHKAPDCFYAAVCPEAHDFIDGRKGGWELWRKRDEWERAYRYTQLWLWETGKVRVT